MDIYRDIYISKSTILRRDNGINISRYLTTWFNVGILSRSGGFTINLWQLWHGENEVLRRWSFGIRVSCFGQHPMENLWENHWQNDQDTWRDLPFMSKAYVVPEERGEGAFFWYIWITTSTMKRLAKFHGNHVTWGSKILNRITIFNFGFKH